MKCRLKAYLQRNIGWAEVLIICAALTLFLRGQLQLWQINKDPAFTRGIIVGEHKGARGSNYFDIVIFLKDKEIQSSMPHHRSYKIGDSIFLKYERDHPNNWVLVRDKK